MTREPTEMEQRVMGALAAMPERAANETVRDFFWRIARTSIRTMKTPSNDMIVAGNRLIARNETADKVFPAMVAAASPEFPGKPTR